MLQNNFNPDTLIRVSDQDVADIVARLPRVARRYPGAAPVGLTEIERERIPTAVGQPIFRSFWVDSIGRLATVLLVMPDGRVAQANEFRWNASDQLMSFVSYTTLSTTSGVSMVVSFTNDGYTVAHSAQPVADRINFAQYSVVGISKSARSCVLRAATQLLPAKAHAQSATTCAIMTATAVISDAALVYDLYKAVSTPLGWAACVASACWGRLAKEAALAVLTTAGAVECWNERNAARNGLPPQNNPVTTTDQSAPAEYIAHGQTPVDLTSHIRNAQEIWTNRLVYLVPQPTLHGSPGPLMGVGVVTVGGGPTSGRGSGSGSATQAADSLKRNMYAP
jgi:hypothetical protein